MRSLLAAVAALAALAALLLATAAPAHAIGGGPTSPPAPAVSVASDGTAAYAYPGDGLLVAAGSLDGGLGAPVTVAPLDELTRLPLPGTWFWVIAEPGGGARALWVARVADYSQADFEVAYQLRSRRLGGPVEQLSPLQPTAPDVDVASNQHGSVLAVWSGGGAFAAAGGAFSPVTGTVPERPQAALAPSGAALIAGHDCAGDTCPVSVTEAGDGRTFGPLAHLPGSASVGGLDAALASDGSAIVAGARVGENEGRTDNGPSYGPVLAFRRRGREGFGGPVVLDRGLVFAARAGVANGGRGVVAFINQGTSASVHELAGDGSVSESPYARDVHVAPPPVAVRDDGAALVGLQFEGVLERPAEGPFARRAPAVDALAAVALSDAGSIVGWPVRAGDAPPSYRAHFGGRDVDLPSSAPVRPAPEYPDLIPDADDLRSGSEVLRRPVRVRGTRALVPVVCHHHDPPVTRRDVCSGTLTARGGQRVRFRITAGTGRYVRVPVGRRQRRLGLTLAGLVGGPEGDPTSLHRLARGPDRRPCRVPEWARTIAESGPRRLVAFSGRGRRGSAVTRVVVCGGGRARRLLTLPPNATLVGYPAALNRRWAAIVERHAGDGLGELWLHTIDLKGGTRRARRLDAGIGSALGYESVRPLGMLILRAGRIAMLDGVEGRVRVRLIDGAGDRIVDPGPGIDRRSLTGVGDSIEWMRGGGPQTARVR